MMRDDDDQNRARISFIIKKQHKNHELHHVMLLDIMKIFSQCEL